MINSLYILTFTSFICAIISAVSGAAGGAILLSVMQWYMNPLEALPIHGYVQWLSNGSRALMSLREIKWGYINRFVVGCAIGVLAGSMVLRFSTPKHLSLLIGLMILGTTLIPRSKNGWKLPGQYLSVGLIQGTLGMVTGAAGPLATSALQRDGLKRDEIVVTSAMMMALLHSFKIGMFFALGMSFGSYGKLLGLMLVASAIGTMVGTRLRSRIPEKQFGIMLKVILVALGLQLVVS